ncbi:MAG: radical SAM protein [Chloroflexi bacterium]|nr:radical SAM protein [Chloroflexota bacterium]
MNWSTIEQARQRLARERGAVRKDWGGRIPIALVYPNSYHVGMSSLGMQTIYRLLNEHDNLVAERFFVEERGAARPGGPPPVSIESQRPPGDFACLAFSVSFELDYFNIVQFLRASGLPLYAADRDDGAPLTIAGGACCITNPEPIAPFFDALVVSEGEAVMPALGEAIAIAARDGRRAALRYLSGVPGVYLPSLMEPGTAQPNARRRWVRDLDTTPAHSVVLTPDTELADMYLIEVSRGCGRGCRFCLAGYVFRPARVRHLDTLLAQAEEGLRLTRRIGLTSPAVSDLPDLEPLVLSLYERGAEISVSSLRVDNLSDAVLNALAASGTRNVTMAPEAGSQRLREVVNKGVAEEQVLAAVEKVARRRVPQLKFYFMVGLPTETDEDVEAMAALLRESKAILDRHRAGTRLVASISPFVPKAGTPWQWLGMAPVGVVDARLARLKAALRPAGIEMRGENAGWAELDACLSRGDRRLAAVLERMDDIKPSSWKRAMAECGLSIDHYVHQEWSPREPLPWQYLDWGMSRKFFELELRRTQSARHTKGCPPDFDNSCRLCGVCTDAVRGPISGRAWERGGPAPERAAAPALALT